MRRTRNYHSRQPAHKAGRTAHLMAAIILGTAGLLWADWEPVGPEGGYIQALCQEPGNPSTLYAVTFEMKIVPLSRLMRSTDRGQEWSEVGWIPNYSINSIAVDPHNTDVLYAAGRADMMFRSTDRGVTWQIESLPNQNYGAEAFPDRFVPGRVYMPGYTYISVDGHYEMVMFVSTDFGASWTRNLVSPNDTLLGYCGCVDPADSAKVYVGGSKGRVYVSTDAGATWESKSNGLPANGVVYSLAVNPANPDVIIAALNRQGVYRTTDGGESWSLVQPTHLCNRVAFSNADPDVGYAGYDTVFVTTDQGTTWTRPDPGLVQLVVSDFVPALDSGSVCFAAGNEGIFRTQDGGTNWFETNHGIRIAVISCLTVNKAMPQRVYLEVSENGVYKTTDAGATWTRCSDFLSCGNIGGIGVAPGESTDVLYALEGKG